VYNELTDKRRKTAAKLAEQASQYYRDFLELLLDLLRTGDEGSVQGLVGIIRGGASHGEILAVIGLNTERGLREDVTWSESQE
jgi:hypothetical protein